METKGKALIDHWSWAAEKGVMNRNTAPGCERHAFKCWASG